jgi:uncharacterized protein (TIGR03790 family)
LQVRIVLIVLILALIRVAHASGLDADRLGVIYNLDDAGSRDVAALYASQHRVPPQNLVGIRLPRTAVIDPKAFAVARNQVLDHLPTNVQSLLLVWSRPYAVGCMSVTTAFAAGYHSSFCEPGCAQTTPNPLFNSDGWLPADTVAWWPAMLLPSDDPELARALIKRAIASETAANTGSLYLVRTQDSARNVRAATYEDARAALTGRVRVIELTTPVQDAVTDAIGYFTGAVRVDELPRLRFRPGAVADHLTSVGGMLAGSGQMSALAWLNQGATASYGTVTEPCNILGKFPNIQVLMSHYAAGETALEAYWKSVAMPGQGLFIGDPLARSFAIRRR